MPLIAVNLSDKLIQEIRELVESGRYASLESFVEIGAFNQIALERGATPAEIIAGGHRTQSADAGTRNTARSPPVTSNTTKSAKVPAARRGTMLESIAKVEAVAPVTPEEAATVFKRLTKPNPATLPKPLPMPPTPLAGDRIFGQVNRLFPVKFVCRWVANVSAGDGQWPRFTAVAARLADDAGTVGSLLDQWDQKQVRERGGELATALPRRKNNASLDRFLSQFVARITRSSEIAPGAVCQYDLARFDDGCLALTEQGAAFAEMDNPILDAHDEASAATLSADEAAFFADHIRSWVPTEWEDMRTVLLAVRAGQASPTEVGATARNALPDDWTASMVSTHVSGVIARLSDIRLLRRSWQGRNVRYELGDPAQVTAFVEH